MTGFLVFSLPRSRSAWLSVFLSRGNRLVGHDIGVECASPDEFLDRLDGDLAGTCETGAGFAWPAIRNARPDLKFATILRNPVDVSLSLERFGLFDMLPEMQRRMAYLAEIAALPGTLNLTFEALCDPQACAVLYEYCLDEPMDERWWRQLDPINIQVDMERQFARLRQNAAQLAELKAAAIRRMNA